MDDFEKAVNDQRSLLDSLNRRITGQIPEIDFEKLNHGTFMSRYYLTNCLEQGWLQSYDPETRKLIIGWAQDYPEFLSRCLKQNWVSIGEPDIKQLILEHAYKAPHRYTLHFLLEGWITPEDPKVKELIIITLNEGNSNIYLDRGWLTQDEVDDILNNY